MLTPLLLREIKQRQQDAFCLLDWPIAEQRGNAGVGESAE